MMSCLYCWHLLHFACCTGRDSKLTSISANANGPRDTASRKIDHIALPTRYNYNLQGNKLLSIANYYADRELSLITTYLNDNAQTPFNRFVVCIQESLQQTRWVGDKSNRWSLSLSVSAIASTVEGTISVVRRRRHCWSQFTEYRGEFFLT